jgi:hypothetical protein
MGYFDPDFKDLIGEKINSVTFDERLLRFNLKDKVVSFSAEGDCCSNSFIESIDDESIFNDAVLESVEVESGEAKEIDTFDVHKCTFYKFKTDKGYATLSFRNESNGYYDGYLAKVQN